MQLENLKTNFLGRNVIYYPKIDSTQSEILRRIEKHQIENGTIIVADLQTEGKGTHGRKWYTTKENNIAFSFFLSADCNIDSLLGLTIKIAQTMIVVFQNLYGITLQIKEPNDLVYRGKKIGGILTQTKVVGQKVKEIVIGIGVNTNQEEFEEEIKQIASSVKKEFNICVDNKKVISQFCNLFEKIFEEMIENE